MLYRTELNFMHEIEMITTETFFEPETRLLREMTQRVAHQAYGNERISRFGI